MTPPAVGLRDLRKRFGHVPILRGVTLELAAGESLALLGPNGAGKSTLLRILAQVCRPSSGEVRILGVECAPERPPPDVRRAIGFVGHEPLVYLDLSARENLAHFARLYGVDVEAPQAALRRVGLAAVADRRVRTFSRGMLQRLALARATLHLPRLLLLDEPFTGLDDEGRGWLAETLVEERARGTTTVLVTHDLEPLVRVASRHLVLVRGEIAAQGPMPTSAGELASAIRAVTGPDAATEAARVGNPA